MGVDGGRELATWVAYLKEIGVKELRISAAQAAPKGAPAEAPARKTRAAAPAPRRRRAEPAGVPSDPAKAQPTLLTVDDGFADPPPSDPALRLQQIRSDLGECSRCKLHGDRTNIVFGVGDPRARLMFVGEGPGENEDLQGEPFVGRAGKKLDEMIVAIGLSRPQVYIANIVKCRPPKNRDPERDEVQTCSPFLVAQIEAIRPRVIVTLGGPATKTLLRTQVGITRLRGSWQSFRGIPVMPTFHPAFVLRNYTVETRKQVWEDLKAARARAEETD